MIDIFGTLGPACASAETLEQMIRRGMTGVRLINVVPIGAGRHLRLHRTGGGLAF